MKNDSTGGDRDTAYDTRKKSWVKNWSHYRTVRNNSGTSRTTKTSTELVRNRASSHLESEMNFVKILVICLLLVSLTVENNEGFTGRYVGRRLRMINGKKLMHEVIYAYIVLPPCKRKREKFPTSSFLSLTLCLFFVCFLFASQLTNQFDKSTIPSSHQVPEVKSNQNRSRFLPWSVCLHSLVLRCADFRSNASSFDYYQSISLNVLLYQTVRQWEYTQ